MNDLPGGDFSKLLVGEHWPSELAVSDVVQASINRREVRSNFTSYSDQLLEIRSGALAKQSGQTADYLRSAFETGVQQARSTAEANEAKNHAYESAHSLATGLRAELSSIALDGESRIRAVQQSKKSMTSKVAEITEIIADSQTRANVKAAACASGILEAMQELLYKQEIDKSARQFSKECGSDTSLMFRGPDKAAITRQVRLILGQDEQPGPLTSEQLNVFQGGSEDRVPPPTTPTDIDRAGQACFLPGAQEPRAPDSFAGIAAPPGQR
ncbi:hypothetical protein, partial [Mycobacterium sp. 1274756.6]|uniref:hypothetical protein n=1 Tax=Mycobacterium sp. 1274756.6 TaxID=1834076 RepID=UPI000B01EF0E